MWDNVDEILDIWIDRMSVNECISYVFIGFYHSSNIKFRLTPSLDFHCINIRHQFV